MTSKQRCIHRTGCAAFQGECERVGYCLGRELNDATLPPLPKHDHAFQDPEGEEPDILVWNAASMRAYALAARRAVETEAPLEEWRKAAIPEGRDAVKTKSALDEVVRASEAVSGYDLDGVPMDKREHQP